jgi:hypothetical protein
MKALAPAIALLLVAGCSLASPEARIREKLVAAGVKPHMADCLAPKLSRKLSTAELEELGKAAKGAGDHRAHLGIGALADRLQGIDDPHVVDVVTRAGLSCAILG